MLPSFVSLASNPATHLKSHPYVSARSNSYRITSLHKNTRGEGHRTHRHPSDRPGNRSQRNLSQLRQNLLLIRDNRIQRPLVLQDRCLILLDRFLVRLDGFLVGNNRRLIRENFLLIRYASVGHVEFPSEVEFEASDNSVEANIAAAIVFLEELKPRRLQRNRVESTSSVAGKRLGVRRLGAAFTVD